MDARKQNSAIKIEAKDAPKNQALSQRSHFVADLSLPLDNFTQIFRFCTYNEVSAFLQVNNKTRAILLNHQSIIRHRILSSDNEIVSLSRERYRRLATTQLRATQLSRPNQRGNYRTFVEVDEKLRADSKETGKRLIRPSTLTRVDEQVAPMLVDFGKMICDCCCNTTVCLLILIIPCMIISLLAGFSLKDSIPTDLGSTLSGVLNYLPIVALLFCILGGCLKKLSSSVLEEDQRRLISDANIPNGHFIRTKAPDLVKRIQDYLSQRSKLYEKCNSANKPATTTETIDFITMVKDIVFANAWLDQPQQSLVKKMVKLNIFKEISIEISEVDHKDEKRPLLSASSPD